jgi:hypothetical protein
MNEQSRLQLIGNKKRWYVVEFNRKLSIKLKVCIMSLFGLVACSMTSLPSEVQHSVNNTESKINIANRQLSNVKTANKENFIQHSDGVYFGSQVILQNKKPLHYKIA